MATKRKPAPLADLGAKGKSLWKNIINDAASDWELDARDLGRAAGLSAHFCFTREAEVWN